MTQLTETPRQVIIFLGTTGSGKSTLIKSLTQETVNTSSEPGSCTTNSKLYSCSLSNSIHLLDTVGTEDTTNKSTEDILFDMCGTIGEKGDTVKIIWIVTPNIKETPQLQAQARFINCLSQDIWKSVTVICKQGTDPSHSQGALAAAKKHTQMQIASYNLHIYDLQENWELNPMFKMMSSMHLCTRTAPQFVLLKFEELEKWLFSIISSLETSRIAMRVIKYHSSKYYEGKRHSGKWCIRGWEVTKLVGGSLGIAAVSSTMIGVPIVGACIGISLNKTYKKEGMNGVDKKIKKVLHVKEWDCCNNYDEDSQGCQTYHKCLWCNQDIQRTEGCKSSWVPQNYTHNPQRTLVQE